MPESDGVQIAWMLCEFMGVVVGFVVLLVVVCCILKGAFDDTMRLIRWIGFHLPKRAKKNPIANATQATVDKNFFSIVNEYHDQLH